MPHDVVLLGVQEASAAEPGLDDESQLAVAVVGSFDNDNDDFDDANEDIASPCGYTIRTCCSDLSCEVGAGGLFNPSCRGWTKGAEESPLLCALGNEPLKLFGVNGGMGEYMGEGGGDVVEGGEEEGRFEVEGGGVVAVGEEEEEGRVRGEGWPDNLEVSSRVDC